MITKRKDYIYSDQEMLFGAKEVIGFGNKDFYVIRMEKDRANKIIIKNHYSHKIYNATYIHLAVCINGELLGVLQFGYAMNPASQGGVVEGTGQDQYLELNRMWLDDKAERNSESRAISYSIKYIRGKYPQIKWIQSFADERCGLYGVVYQSANFSYYGEHKSDFWELDGEVYHNIQMTISPNNKERYNKKIKNLQDNKHRAVRMTLRQFRYIYFLDGRWKKRCLLKEQPYPKKTKLAI